MTAITAPVMRYHGAKFRLADWVISLFPTHECYVEPFGGAAGVLMQKPRSYAEVYNDLNGEVVNVFRVLRDPEQSQRLAELCVLTPFARNEFELSREPAECPIEQARRTLFRAAAGFGSGGATHCNTGFRTDSKRAYSLSSHVWQKYPDHIAAFCERLSGVIIENRPALEVIKAHDSPDTLHFVDPPYILGTRVLGNRNGVYQHEMTDDDHAELLDFLNQMKGAVVITGYQHPIYTAALSDWHMVTKQAQVSAHRGSGIRTECAWLNRKANDGLAQMRIFA